MRLHLALSVLLLASLLPALPAAAAAPPAPAPSDECAHAADAEICVYEHWSTGDTCVAVHRGEWIHVTRCAPLRGPAPAASPASADAAGRICTYHLVEAVAVCVGTDGCVTVYLGPSARTVCAGHLVADPYVCTTDLIESVSVCENAQGCLALYFGPREYPLCVVTTASAAGATGAGCTWAGPVGVCRDGSLARGCAGAYYGVHEIYHTCWTEASASSAAPSDGCAYVQPFSACTTSDERGTCVGVYANRAVVLHECVSKATAAAAAAVPALGWCVPDGIEVVEVCLEGLCPVVWLGPGAVRPCDAIEVTQCVFDDGRSRVCWENGADGLCVYGNVAHPSFRECVGRVTIAATPVDAGACAEPIDNLRVCRDTNAQGDSCVRVEASYSSWEQCFSPRADAPARAPDCVNPIPGTSLCVYRNENGQTCVGPSLGNQPFEQCTPPRPQPRAAKVCAPAEVVCAWTSNGEVCTSSRTGNLEDPAVWCQRVLA